MLIAFRIKDNYVLITNPILINYSNSVGHVYSREMQQLSRYIALRQFQSLNHHLITTLTSGMSHKPCGICFLLFNF
jgi:hypothetical protein